MEFNFNVSKVCRLCTGDENQLLPLFDRSEDLPAKIKILAPYIQISAGDGLPNQICEECVQRVNSFYDFKIMVEASDSNLRDLIRLQQERLHDEVLFVKEEDAANEAVYTSVLSEDQAENVPQDVEDPLLIKQECDYMIIEDSMQDTNEAANSCHSSNEDRNVYADFKTETASHVPGSTEICMSERRLYECAICTRKFTTFQGLRVHRKSHAEKHGYECMICNRRFNTWQRFRGHRRTHTKGLRLQCSHCSKRFNSDLGLKIHYTRYHTERKTFECDVCKECFRSEQKLKLHSKYHTNMQQHACLVCKESFSTRLALRLHNRTHSEAPVRTLCTSQEPIECIYCKKSFPNLKAIAGHHRFCRSRSFTEISVPSSSQPNTSPLDANHECPICKKSFIELRSLTFHIRTHKFLTQRCSDCFRSFKSVKNLNYHRKRMHSCSVNKKQAVPEHNLISLEGNFENNQKGTMITDNEGVRYECKHCRKVFTNERALVCHSDNIHKNEKLQSDAVLSVANSFTTQQEKIDTDIQTDSVTTVNEQMGSKCTICNVILKNEQGLRSHTGKMHKQNSQQNDMRTAREDSFHRESGNAGVVDQINATATENEYMTYECKICKIVFRNARALRLHNGKDHRLQNDSALSLGNNFLTQQESADTDDQIDNQHVIYECAICNVIVKTARGLACHRSRIHKQQNDTESAFENSFVTEPESTGVNNQIERTNTKNYRMTYECTPCNMSFRNVRGLRSHTSRMHKELWRDTGSASEDIVLTEAGNASTIDQMETAATDNEQGRSECTPCNRIFRNERALRTHTIRMHQTKNLWRDMGLTYEDNFRTDPGSIENATMHNGQVGFECTPCNRIFESVKGLRCHNSTIHKNLSANEDTILTEPGNTNTNNEIDNEQERSECVLCNRIFRNERALRNHIIKMHKNKNLWRNMGLTYEDYFHTDLRNTENATIDNGQVGFECTPCNRIFESIRGLRCHNSTIHKNLSAYEDTILTEPGNTNTNNEMDIETPDNEQVTSECALCNRIFRNERALRTHTIRTHKTKNLWHDMGLTYEDNFCTDPGNTENATIGNGQVGFECTPCNRIFESIKGLRCHNTTVHKNSASEDTILSKPGNTNTNNQMSIETPDNEQVRSECTPCNRIFKNERALRAHNSSAHKQKNLWHFMELTYEDNYVTDPRNTEQVRYECTICNLVVKSARGLSSHKTRIHKQKNLQSNNVSEVEDGLVTEPENTDINNEIGSITTDNDQVIYECTSCSMTFRNVRGLRSHSSRIHRNLWRDTGSACGNEDILAEPGNTNTNDQMEIGTTDNKQGRSFECTTCNLVFESARGLACHSGRVHKQKNVHSDTMLALGEDFVTEPDNTCSNEQIKAITADNEEVGRYECTLCNIIFKNIRALRSHSSKMHKHLWRDKGSASEEVVVPGNADTNDQIETATTDNEQRRFECAICKLFFKTARNLATHSARIHKQKKSQSDKTSVIEDNLLARRITADKKNQSNSATTETEEMRYMCHECGMIFKNIRHLRYHSLRIHNQTESLPVSSDEPHSSLRFQYWNYKVRSQLRNSTDKDNKSNNGRNVDVTENGDANKEYDCPDCDRTFDREMGLLIHRSKLHKTSDTAKSDNRDNAILNHQCHICDKSFRTLIGCTMHMSKVHTSSFSDESSPERYECLVCHETFYHLKGFRIHCTKQQHMVGGNIDQQRDEDSTKCYECTSCGKRYFSLKNYNRHMSQIHSVRPAAAVNTETLSGTSQAVASTSSLNEMFSCVLCDKSYSNKNDLKVHLSSVHNECNSEIQGQIIADALQNLELTSTVKCCNKLFTSRKGLKIHQGRFHRDDDLSPKMTEASVEEDSICLVCDKVFMNKRRLAIHEAKYHSAAENPEMSSIEDTDAVNSVEKRESLLYECSLCKMSFTSSKSLNLHHSKRHNSMETTTSHENDEPLTEEKQFECSFCKSVFCSERGLKVHCSRNHKFEVRMELCNNMDVTAANEVENSSPTACSICNEELYTEEELTLHYNKTHTEVFCSRDNVPPAYTFSHQKQIDYDCRDCEKTFSSEEVFRAHVNDHQSDDGSTECNLCHINFITSSNLQLHNQQAHTSAPD